jgi:hypothetical protein
MIIYLPLTEKKIVLTSIREKAIQENHGNLQLSSSSLILISKENNRAATIISPGPFSKEPAISELFRCKSIYSFYMNYNYNSSTPFSLIAYEDNTLFELFWNGESHALKNLLVTKGYFWQIEDEKVVRKEMSNGLLESIKNLHNSDVETVGKIHGELNNHLEKEGIVKSNSHRPICFTTVIKDITGMRMVYEDKANRILNELAI